MSADIRRIVAFAGLASFASYHWFLLVQGAQAGRWIGCIAIGVAGALTLLALKGRRRSVVVAGTFAVFASMLTGGLLAIGIPLDHLAPGGWDDLREQLSRGLGGVSEINTPYAGENPWTKLGVLAAVPLAVALAILSAFWPAGKGRIGRAIGLGVLVLLYATSVTWEAPSAELLRGALLFAAVAAVLWLPGLKAPHASAAVATVLLAVVVAFPLASRVDASDPIVGYSDWRVFGFEKRIAFNWNHTYGELDWPQKGTEVFVATTDQPLYWKTYVLDEFSSSAWGRDGDGFGEAGAEYDLAGASAELVADHPEWVRSFDIEFTGLQSRLAVTSGSPLQIDGIDIGDSSGDGTTTSDDFEIPEDSSYSVLAYVPDPTVRELRQARGVHPAGAERYTSLVLPLYLSPTDQRIGRPTQNSLAVVPPRGVAKSPNERGLPRSDVPIGQVVEGTAYEQVLELTRSLVAGAETDYEAVARIQRFLTTTYAYDQDVPLSAEPLPAFLFEDRAGYCQQFSGAMTLMLRMAGIPSRVVSGFATGVPKEDGYSVGDTDAHSWVEVLFPGIGWVTFDPTPGQTPARTNLDIPGAASGSAGLDRAIGRALTDRDEPDRGLPGALEGARASDDGGTPVPLIAIFVLGGLGTGVIVKRRRRLGSPEGAELQLRELTEALEATGWAPAPGATLSSIQGRLSAGVGPDAARYVAALRDSRYARRARRRPGPADRRSFRWALARRSGIWGWWKALRAIPPGGPRG